MVFQTKWYTTPWPSIEHLLKLNSFLHSIQERDFRKSSRKKHPRDEWGMWEQGQQASTHKQAPGQLKFLQYNKRKTQATFNLRIQQNNLKQEIGKRAEVVELVQLFHEKRQVKLNLECRQITNQVKTSTEIFLEVAGAPLTTMHKHMRERESLTITDRSRSRSRGHRLSASGGGSYGENNCEHGQ